MKTRKARVIETGEIIEVSGGDAPADPWYLTEDKAYHEDELDFNTDSGQKEVTLKGWIARDKDGTLTVFYNCDKPKRRDNDEYWSCIFGCDMEYLSDKLFPDITWEDEPRRVEITVKIKE